MLKRIISLLRTGLFGKRGVTVSFTSTNNAAASYTIAPNKSLLDGLLEHSLSLPFSCKAGVCQSCKMYCDDPAAIPEKAKSGLSIAEKQLGYFLPCVCFPEKNLKIKSIDAPKPVIETEILELTLLNQDILILKLCAPFPYKAGQFCNLYRDASSFRSYSIASASNEGVLEFHIKVVEGGLFSSWAKNELKKGDFLSVQGPYGTCVHVASKEAKQSKKNILLSGTGTGLAPLLGIIRDVLNTSDDYQMHLVLGAKSSSNFYFEDTLQQLAEKHKQIKIDWLCASPPAPGRANAQQADIYQFVETTYSDLSDFKVYLCGAESFVHKMKKTCYLNNASLSDISSDAFVPQA